MIRSFAGMGVGGDGAHPNGAAYDAVSGLVYVATEWGGDKNCGTVFRTTNTP